jgi:hypothetical protein
MAYSTYIQAMVDRVAAYIGRTNTSFTVGTVDNILSALNDSRSRAQQAYDWQQLKVTGVMYLNGASGAPWYTPNSGGYGPKTADTAGQALFIKKVDSLWNYVKDANSVMLRTNRIDFATDRQFKSLLPTNMGFPFSMTYPTNPPYYINTIPSQQIFAYVIGPDIFVNSCATPTFYMFDGTKKLPDLTGAETSDFFIDNYQNWLLYATLQNLNGFLKEDQRVAISASLLDKAWTDATFDDSRVGCMGEWSNLD